ncbi:hypothetical protein [Streptomyces chromofuscus]|uniref:Uncharacterized protein n=1 Tax=Streptomyces chromofuscus TaxID=42881 RepID=A0A7M2TH71_STRCW|nr:hypothetical protein [Streptomyces chromofuscus]QOV47245.1 hypothetical protein IPT68_16030 [Streptomyces chromofuscus]GGT24463.1 hypothetical protein GCM10010254_51090 [Streptomyces chromofuscus]
MSDETVVKPQDIHATSEPASADAGSDTEGGATTQGDIHATEEPLETKDIHATSEPFKPTK